MRTSICLNADLGELEGDTGRAMDAAMLAVVSRCSIACGGHAGDAVSMQKTLEMATAYGVETGAHPSYPDREYFGRKTLEIRTEDLLVALSEQIQALKAIAAPPGAEITFVKPHGALYNDAARSASLADCVAEATARAGITYLIGPPRSALARAAKSFNLTYVAEGFVDRLYQPDGSLMPRTVPGAVLADNARRISQALDLATNQRVTASDGQRIALSVQTLCLHGDTEGAATSARDIRNALTQAGITIKASAS